MTYSSGAVTPLYSTLAGGFWNFHFARRFEFQTRVMVGWAWMAEGASANLGKDSSDSKAMAAFSPVGRSDSGIDLAAGISLSIITDSNFKFKAFADFESISFGSTRPWVNTLVLGWSSAWFW